MKKLFDQKPVLFAVLCIVVYVMGFGTLGTVSDHAAVNAAAQIVFGFVLSAVLLAFAEKNGLYPYWFLQGFQGEWKRMLYFVPLAAAVTVNLWGGIAMPASTLPVLLLTLFAKGICAPFLEELIFRGILFRAIGKKSTRQGFWWAALGFGIGHAVNFIFGKGGIDTFMQMLYACAVGFAFTAVVFAGRSLLPTIIAHMIINSTSLFSPDRLDGTAFEYGSIAVFSGLCIAYGIWVLHGAAHKLTTEPLA